MERQMIQGDNPVSVTKLRQLISSRAGHEKSRLNMGGPPSKTKYQLVTDSEQVP